MVNHKGNIRADSQQASSDQSNSELHNSQSGVRASDVSDGRISEKRRASEQRSSSNISYVNQPDVRDAAHMENWKQDGSLPRGLKIALLASSCTILVVVGLFSLLMYVSGDIQNSSKIKSIASSFMKISEPLPEGFTYASGLDFLGTKLVMISQPQTGAVWTIVHISPAEGALPPESVINQIEAAAANSRKFTHTPGSFIVHQKGTQAVGGRTLTYETGALTSGGTTSGSFIGCFMPDKNGTTCIFGNNPLGKFDSFANDELMHGIDTI